MGREAPKSISLLAQLLQSVHSNEHDIALKSLVELIVSCVPPEIGQTVNRALLFLQQKLARQPTDIETIFSLPNNLLSDEGQQLLVAARQPTMALMSNALTPIDECLGAATSLMKLFKVDNEAIASVDRAQKIRMPLTHLPECLTNFCHTDSLHDQTRQMKPIAENIQQLLNQMNPNVSTLATNPLEMIYHICNLIMAKISLTMIFDSIAIVDLAVEAFSQPSDATSTAVSVTSPKPRVADVTISRAASTEVNATAIHDDDATLLVSNSTPITTISSQLKNRS
jgi:hypothetical protein